LLKKQPNKSTGTLKPCLLDLQLDLLHSITSHIRVQTLEIIPKDFITIHNWSQEIPRLTFNDNNKTTTTMAAPNLHVLLPLLHVLLPFCLPGFTERENST
jgi:hypothetical protein